MLRVKLRRKPLSVLDFDLENRPLSYVGQGFTSAEITAMAWSWVGQDAVSSLVLVALDHYEDENGDRFTALGALNILRSHLTAADLVTGHYIRKHDLPLLNGALLERGLPPLGPLLVHDTHSDLTRRKDLSASQEALADMYRLPEAKHHMSQAEWREANRLTPEGVKLTRKRVVDDVIQHKALRRRLIEAGAMRPARWWKP